MPRNIYFLLSIVIKTAILCLAPSVIAADFRLGVINDPDGYSNVRKGPGTEYEVVRMLLQPDYFLYDTSGKDDWIEIFSPADTVLIGYLHKSRIAAPKKLPAIATGAYNISYSKDGETGYMRFVMKVEGSGGMVFCVPDTANQEWITAYKPRWIDEKYFGEDALVKYDEWNRIVAGRYPFDSIAVYEHPIGYYKKTERFSADNMYRLSIIIRNVPIYFGNNGEGNDESLPRCLPSYYTPVKHQHFYNGFFDEHYQDFFEKKYGSYAEMKEPDKTYPAWYEQRISCAVTVDGDTCYVILVPSTEPFFTTNLFFSRKKFDNLEYPVIDLPENATAWISEILSFDVDLLLEKYGAPIFMNDDVLVYITDSHKRFLVTDFDAQKKLPVGRTEEIQNGLMFFEFDNGRVVVAGSHTMTYVNH